MHKYYIFPMSLLDKNSRMSSCQIMDGKQLWECICFQIGFVISYMTYRAIDK